MSGIEQILVKSGLVSEDLLNSEVQTAEYFGIAPGHMIAGSKHVSDKAFVVCYKLDSLLADNVINLMQAAQIARFIVKHNKTWNDALLSVIGTLVRPESNKLGELLVEAGLITPIQAAAAMFTASRKGTTIGQALIDTRLVSRTVVVRALALQDCIRERRMPSMLAPGHLRFNSLNSNVQQGTVRKQVA